MVSECIDWINKTMPGSRITEVTKGKGAMFSGYQGTQKLKYIWNTREVLISVDQEELYHLECTLLMPKTSLTSGLPRLVKSD